MNITDYQQHVSMEMNRLKGAQYSYVFSTVRLVGTKTLNTLTEKMHGMDSLKMY